MFIEGRSSRESRSRRGGDNNDNKDEKENVDGADGKKKRRWARNKKSTDKKTISISTDTLKVYFLTFIMYWYTVSSVGFTFVPAICVLICSLQLDIEIDNESSTFH